MDLPSRTLDGGTIYATAEEHVAYAAHAMQAAAGTSSRAGG
jgi:hypothetical protein